MKIILLSIGKTNNQHFRGACDDYLKRLGSYIKVEEMLLPDVSLGPSVSLAVVAEKQSDRLLDKIKDGAHVVLMDEKGERHTSLSMASFLSNCMVRSIRELVVVSGGAYGVDDRIRTRANKIVSLSDLTLPHQLARLVMLEQLYRSFTIIKGEKYHHEGSF